MSNFIYLALLSLSLFITNVISLSQSRTAMGKINSHHSWVSYSGKASVDTMHEITIAVQKLNLDYIESSLIERSTPGNALYQEWLTFDQVGEFTTNREGYNVIQNWLLSENIDITWVSTFNHYIKASATIKTWERVLEADFHIWKNTENGHSYTRAHSFSVASDISPYISAVFGITDIPPPVKQHFQMPEIMKNKNTAEQPYRTDMIISTSSTGLSSLRRNGEDDKSQHATTSSASTAASASDRAVKSALKQVENAEHASRKLDDSTTITDQQVSVRFFE